MKMHEFLEKHPNFKIEILYFPQTEVYKIDVYDRTRYYILIKSFACTKELLNATYENFDGIVGSLLNEWYTKREGGGAE